MQNRKKGRDLPRPYPCIVQNRSTGSVVVASRLRVDLLPMLQVDVDEAVKLNPYLREGV